MLLLTGEAGVRALPLKEPPAGRIFTDTHYCRNTMNSKFGLITGTDQSELKEVPDNPGFLALPEAGTAFREMQKAAEKDGIDLKIASSYRDFQRQLKIWNAKYDGERPVLDWRNRPVDISRLTGVELVCAILFWSALPGTSRHHFGTDFDVYAPKLAPEGYQLKLETEEYGKGGVYHQLTGWLDANMEKFGFFRPFTDDAKVTVGTELWHISYRKTATELAKIQQESKEDFRKFIGGQDIAGRAVITCMIDDIFSEFLAA